ncbi:MAG: GNAT family N-acetyltransferase [Planctomycetales bacterium]|nr:GNAT family N-acetyltransferase [Planctomycetales bacterium]
MSIGIEKLTSGEVRIRPYRAEDYSILHSLMVEAFDGVSIDHAIDSELGKITANDWKWRKGRHLKEDIERDIDGVLVAELNGHPVGFITTWQDAEAGIGHIPNLAVATGCRGLGIGRTLIKAAIERFRRANLSAAKIETLEQNDRANALYTSEGFVEVSRQIHFVQDLREPLPPGN